MNHQNYLYLEYQRALRKFRKLQLRFEKRISKDTFQELTARRRYKLLSQLRKLKQKIEQLSGRLKLAAAAGALTLSFGIQESQAQEEVIPFPQAVVASGVPGTPKYLTIDKTLVNDETTGSQQKPDISYNNNDHFVAVWEQNGDLLGRVVGDDSEEFNFEMIGGEDEYLYNPAVAFNDEGEFVVAWEETGPGNYSIKYQRFVGLEDNGTYTVASGSNAHSDVDIDLDNSGNLVVAWQEEQSGIQEVNAIHYAADNSTDGEFTVSQNSTNDQITPSVDMDEEGNFIVVWKGREGSGTTYSVLNVRKYNNGVPQDDAEVLISFSDYSANKAKTPDVDLNGDGSFAVAWEYEDFVGSSEYIRAQIFDGDGSPQVDGDISVAGFSYVSNPKIAADKDGGFVVVYDAEDNGTYEYIQGSRYNRFGDEIESWDFYNDGGEDNRAGHPAIGMNDRGDFVVAWEDNLNAIGGECTYGDCDGYGIYFTQYQDGENQPYSVSSSEIVNTYDNGDQILPAIAKDGDGNYVVVWQGYSGEDIQDEILGQRFNNEGEKIGDEFIINTTTTDDQTQPDVAMNADGDFIVTWASYDEASSSQRIYAQMYNASAEPIGTEHLLASEFDYSEPAVAIDEDGDAIVVYVQDYFNVLARRINADGTLDGDEFKIDAKTDSGSRSYPDVALDNDGNFVATFGIKEGIYEDTYYRRFDAANTALDAEDVKISFGSQSETRRQSIVMDGDGNFAIAYTEYYDDYSAVYLSKFTSGGAGVFEDKEIVSYATNDFVPGLDVNNNGEMVVSWSEPFDGDLNPVSMLDADGDFIFEGFLPFSSSTGSNPVVIVDDNGKATMVRERYNYPNGYAVFASTFSKPLEINIDAGNEFIVNGISSDDQNNPDIAQNANGDFVVVWEDHYNGSISAYNIKAQLYNSEGVRQGAEMTVNDGGLEVGSPEVSLNDDGNFMVVWTSDGGDIGGNSDDIVGKVFDWDREVVKSEFILNTATSGIQRNPNIALNEEGGFIVVWNDRSNFSTNAIVAQKYSSSGAADAAGNQYLGGVDNTHEQLELALAVNGDGDFGITYHFDYSGDYYSGLAVYKSSMELISDQPVTENTQASKAGITADENGDFVVVWSEYYDEENPYQLLARRYSKVSENFASGPLEVAQPNEGFGPAIVAVDDGDFVVSFIDDVSVYGVYTQRISSDLEPIGPTNQINEISIGDSYQVAMASSPDGSYTIAWESGYADDNGYAVVARQFVSHKPSVEIFGLTLDEGAESTLSSEHLELGSPAGSSENAYITFTSIPENGTLTVEGGALVEDDELGIDDIGLLTYTHDGEESTEDSFTFTVANEDFETNSQTFSISINPINDIPDLTANHGMELDEGDSQSLYESLSVTDPDNSSSEISYTLISVPEFGSLFRDEQTNALGVGDTFTQSEVGSGTISYQNDGSESATDGFEFTLSDLESTSETHQYDITINPVNDAPTLANAIDDQTGTVDDPFTFELAENVFEDVDGDELTLSAS
ncbi:MAG: cadherin-like domain-containing protein, partial [Reichenbachiella sp.]|uniref:cadherin-like domain-containing protein n=1 Tax=Reichenbachiella sp. TaxID=2184521 RepID=UPI0032971489